MPDDLLRYVSGPTPYAGLWAWLAVVLILMLIAWYAGVFIFTMPARRLRDLPLIGRASSEVLRHRFARAVRSIGNRYRSGQLDAAQAGAGVSHELRGFLQQTTGVRARFMQIDDLANSEIALAAPIFVELIDAQFNDESTVDMGQVSADAEELIRSWA